MAGSRTRPLVAPPDGDVAEQEPEAAAASASVSSDEKLHQPASPKTRFLSQVVEEVISSWPKNKNFTPAQVHEKVLDSDYQLTSTSSSAVQQKILEMQRAGLITRVSRGRYIKGTPEKPKTAVKKTVKKKKASKPKAKATKKVEPAPPKVEPTPAPQDHEVTSEDLSSLVDPKTRVEEAFDEMINAARSYDTQDPEYWTLLGNLCRVSGRLKDIISGNVE